MRTCRFAGNWLSLNDLKFSHDGKTLATASNDTESNIVGEKPEKGSTRIWDLATGKELKRFPVEGCNVRSVAFSPTSCSPPVSRMVRSVFMIWRRAGSIRQGCVLRQICRRRELGRPLRPCSGQ